MRFLLFERFRTPHPACPGGVTLPCRCRCLKAKSRGLHRNFPLSRRSGRTPGSLRTLSDGYIRGIQARRRRCETPKSCGVGCAPYAPEVFRTFLVQLPDNDRYLDGALDASTRLALRGKLNKDRVQRALV